MKGWHFYNHAAVPDCLLTEEPDMTPLTDGSVWKMSNGGAPLLVRYTTNFDCKEETQYWYVVKDGPFDMNELSQKQRHHIRTALKRCKVEKVNPKEYFEALYEVYHAAYLQYEQADNEHNKEQFKHRCETTKEDCWAAFSIEDGKLIGFMLCKNEGKYTETIMGKYHPDYQKLQPSNAIHYTILNYYLNEIGQKFVCSGTRNINHKTNVQEYKLQHWHFRKAYCHLHVEICPKYRCLFRVVYPLRGLFRLFDKNTRIHQINSLMKLYELRYK